MVYILSVFGGALVAFVAIWVIAERFILKPKAKDNGLFSDVSEELIHITINEHHQKLWTVYKNHYGLMGNEYSIDRNITLFYDRIVMYADMHHMTIGYIVDNDTVETLGLLPIQHMEYEIGKVVTFSCKNSIGVDKIINEDVPVVKYYHREKMVALNSVGYSLTKKSYVDIRFGYLDDELYVAGLGRVDASIQITKNKFDVNGKNYDRWVC